ncbi:MAG: ABC transporter permease [Gemmatimonadetes bacterium]|nr:ABC transporter permease [Gemmatimonadota bacterium]
MGKLRRRGRQDPGVRLIVLSFWARLAMRIRAAVARRSIRNEIDGELAYHIEMRARDLEGSGASHIGARRTAESLFGDYARIRSECREIMLVDGKHERGNVMGEFVHDLRYALRAIFKNPGFAATVVLTLALGIGANTAIFSVVDGVLLRPLPFAGSDDLVMVWQNDRLRGTQLEWFSGPDYFDVLERNVVFEDLAAWQFIGATLTGVDAEPQVIRAARTTHSLFHILGVQPMLGRVYDAEDDRPGGDAVVVLSYQLWASRFGSDETIIGRRVVVEGSPYEVIGVMPPGFAYPTIGTDLWAPLQMNPTSRPRGNHNFRVLARLADAVTLERANANVTAIAADLEVEFADDNLGRGMWVQGMLDATVGRVRPALLVLLGSVTLVLLIACVNVANLLFARATVREREVAIRTALGAGRRRLLRQFLTESGVLAVAGGAAGVLLAFAGLRGLVALGPASLPRLSNVTIDVRVLAFAAIVSLATGLLFGILPALQASNPDLQSPLKEGTRTAAAAGKHRLRRFLVVTEVALAVVLVTGSGLLIRSFWRLQQVDPGFASTNVLVANIQLPTSRYPQSFGQGDFAEVLGFHRQLLERVGRLPGVQAHALAVHHPLNPGWTSRFTVDNRPPVTAGEQEEARINPVSPAYFRTVGIPMVRGRGFAQQDRAGAAPVVIINETFARRHFAGQDPVGQRISFWGQSREIVGVAQDVKFRGLSRETRQGWYAPLEQIPFGAFSLLVRTDEELGSIVPMLQQEVGAIDRDLPVFGATTLEDRLIASVAQPRFNMLLLGLFATVAVILAAVGIYGVMSFAVTQRTHEIGVRISLGAQAGDLLKQVVGQGLVLAGVGVAIGLAGSLAFTRALGSLLFGVGTTDIPTFAVVAMVIGMVAALATYMPARRASKVDPMVALRGE